MATHSSILAWRILMDRGGWWSVVHGIVESDMIEATEHRHINTHTHTHTHTEAIIHPILGVVFNRFPCHLLGYVLLCLSDSF